MGLDILANYTGQAGNHRIPCWSLFSYCILSPSRHNVSDLVSAVFREACISVIFYVSDLAMQPYEGIRFMTNKGLSSHFQVKHLHSFQTHA